MYSFLSKSSYNEFFQKQQTKLDDLSFAEGPQKES